MNRLIEDNVDLVSVMVHQTASAFPPHVDKDEIWQSGAYGLVFASRRFDPSQGVPFRRFAAKHIKWAIINEARARDWAPRSVRTAAKDLDQARLACTARLGRPPTPSELADNLGICVDNLHRLVHRAHVSMMLSLDAVGDDTDEVTLGEVVVDEGATAAFDELEYFETLRYLYAAVRCLPERHALVTRGYWFEGRTSRAIADELGVTESRVSQLRSEALEMLRDGIEAASESAATDDGPAGRVQRRKAAYANAVRSALVSEAVHRVA